MLFDEQKTEAYFLAAADVLGETKEENVKYARMLYIQAIATKRFS